MSIFNDIFGQTSSTPVSTGVITDLQTKPVNPLLQQDMEALAHLNPGANHILELALSKAKEHRNAFVEPAHLLLASLTDRDIYNLLNSFSVDVAALSRELETNLGNAAFVGEPTLSESSKQVFEAAYDKVKKRNTSFITPADILLAIFARSEELASTLSNKGVDRAKIEEKIASSPGKYSEKVSAVEQYTTDLVNVAREGKLDPIFGRDEEVVRLIQILSRRIKNNPLLIGEAGVGKTAVVEGFCQMIVSNQVPENLANVKVCRLDVSSLIAGASHRGEFEERLQHLIKEVIASNGKILLFVDEIHTLIGAGDSKGSLDASNILKPCLSRGQLQMIGTTTTSEYRKYFEKDRAFSRRFQPIMVPEPSEDNSVGMIKVLQPKYEKYHNVVFSPDAINSAVKLSNRYVAERFLPDKAIDLLDEAGAQVKIEVNKGKRTSNIVTEEDIRISVSRWTGIPLIKLSEQEGDKLIHLEDLIHHRLVNQNVAVKAIAEAVRRGRVGLSNVNRPVSFIFLGPTGTGKTELAKTLAEILFGLETAMIRLDMSEYMEKHEVAKLLGAPPGYVGYEEGGQLTEEVRSKPYSIVLLDEIEKAHPDVFNILLQILEDGRLTDNKGNLVSFKNTIIIATSNIGSDLIAQKLGNHVAWEQYTQNNVPGTGTEQSRAKIYEDVKKIVMEQLSKFLKPELINRFDELVIFEPLSQENMVKITQLVLQATMSKLKEYGVSLHISQLALQRLAKEGYDPVYGGRPLRRLVQTSIENNLAVMLINGSLRQGDTVMVDFNPETDKFTFQKANVQPV